MRFLKNKLFISVVLVAILAFGGIFLLSNVKNKTNTILSFERNLNDYEEKINTATSLIAAKDSDNDGLKDWEESLWKTDPQNPDTDEDGTLDGEEIKQDRNPVKAGPNDKMSSVQLELKKDASQEKPEVETLTETLLKKAIASYTVIDKSGKKLDEEMKKKIGDLLAEEVVRKTNTNDSPKYTNKDILIIDGNNVEDFALYKKKLVDIYTKYTDIYNENEFEIVNSAMKNNDPEELEKLDVFTNAYEEIINQLLLLKIPSELALLHLDIINEYNEILKSLNNMKFALKDPILGLVGLIQYQINIEKIAVMSNEIIKTIDEKTNSVQ